MTCQRWPRLQILFLLCCSPKSQRAFRISAVRRRCSTIAFWSATLIRCNRFVSWREIEPYNRSTWLHVFVVFTSHEVMILKFLSNRTTDRHGQRPVHSLSRTTKNSAQSDRLVQSHIRNRRPESKSYSIRKPAHFASTSSSSSSSSSSKESSMMLPIRCYNMPFCSRRDTSRRSPLSSASIRDPSLPILPISKRSTN